MYTLNLFYIFWPFRHMLVAGRVCTRSHSYSDCQLSSVNVSSIRVVPCHFSLSYIPSAWKVGLSVIKPQQSSSDARRKMEASEYAGFSYIYTQLLFSETNQTWPVWSQLEGVIFLDHTNSYVNAIKVRHSHIGSLKSVSLQRVFTCTHSTISRLLILFSLLDG